MRARYFVPLPFLNARASSSITIQVRGTTNDSKDIIKLRGCVKRGFFLLDACYRNSQEMRIVNGSSKVTYVKKLL
jgi:hypothetical protein